MKKTAITAIFLVWAAGYAFCERAQVDAKLKIPPRIISFSVNNGADVTSDPLVTFHYRAMGAPGQYRHRINATPWSAWQACIPGREAAGKLLANDCEQLVYFQVRNEYGESNVMTDRIYFRLMKNVSVTASAAMGYCSGNGWTFAVTKKDCNDCAHLLAFAHDGVILCEIHASAAGGDPIPQGHKCEFVLFGGRSLKEGWEFVSYELTLPIGIGAGRENGYAILQQPGPGARDITLKIRLWHDILRYSQGIQFLVKRITLKGPCDRPVSEAFR